MSSENVPSRISRCLEEGAEEFFLKPVRLSDVNKLKPHIMKTKTKETHEHQPQHQETNQEQHKQDQEHEEQQNALEIPEEVESEQQSNGSKRKSVEEESVTKQNKTQIQWWPICRFD